MTIKDPNHAREGYVRTVGIFWKILLRGLLSATGILAALYILIILLGLADRAGGLLTSVILASLFTLTGIILLAVYMSRYPVRKKDRPTMFRFFQLGIRVVIFLLLAIGLWGVLEIFNRTDCGECAVFQAVGLSIVILWSVVFLSYFIWAVYYYNINYGLTEEDWEKIFDAKESKRNGDLYSEDVLNREPDGNPYKGETFGLPSGTVRGMIAFTLLFGAVALLVVSFGMKHELDASSMFWDQYEFFKTAFLMMIAFYFGSRSLQYLRPESSPRPDRPEGPAGDRVTEKHAIGGAIPVGQFQDVNPMETGKEQEIVEADKNEESNSTGEGADPGKASSTERVSGLDVDPMKK